MSSSNTWQDRRGMFQSGKAVHEPARRPSGAGVVEAVRRASVSSQEGQPLAKTDTATSNTTAGSRRRSSGAAFQGLTELKRGSQDYGDRRASHSEMHGNQGIVAGWFNKTFRGMQPTTEQPEPVAVKQAPLPKTEPKRGVMEWYEHRTDSI